MTQRKKLIALFLVGLLFMGLGGGIAFVEFSSFHFVGEKQLEQEAMQTETFVRRIESENRPLIINYYHSDFHGNKKINIVADDSLDDETIVFDVTYHPGVASIHINYHYGGEEEYYDDHDERKARIVDEYYIGVDHHVGSFFRYMETFLQDMKNKELYEYQIQDSGDLTVRVSPKNISRVQRGYY